MRKLEVIIGDFDKFKENQHCVDIENVLKFSFSETSEPHELGIGIFTTFDCEV